MLQKLQVSSKIRAQHHLKTHLRCFLSEVSKNIIFCVKFDVVLVVDETNQSRDRPVCLWKGVYPLRSVLVLASTHKCDESTTIFI